jgi:hypothetical protein
MLNNEAERNKKVEQVKRNCETIFENIVGSSRLAYFLTSASKRSKKPQGHYFLPTLMKKDAPFYFS